VCRLDTLLGQGFADAAALGIALTGGADLVVSHGQTVFHWVSSGSVLGTLQLGQPAWIAARTGLPVVSDLRSRDLTVGGQGAPLVSILDVLLLPPGPSARAALNLGGIANLTVIPPSGEPFAYDVGPANALIDDAARRSFGAPYDADGAHARAGRVHAAFLERLLDHPYFSESPPKTTGKELFHRGYVDARLDGLTLPPEDVLATLTELTAHTIAADLERHAVTEVVPSGGGVRNPFLMSRLAALAPGVTFWPIDELGLPSDAKEAYLFAVLGFLTFHGLPATVPSCTGASSPSLLGSVTPGAGPLRLPPPAPATPRRLRVVAG
jgi:anhydro-N-acetylmuramic acid kinase